MLQRKLKWYIWTLKHYLSIKEVTCWYMLCDALVWILSMSKKSDKKSHIVLTYLCEIPRINKSIIHGNQFVITRVRGRGGLGNNCWIDEDSLGCDENALTLGRYVTAQHLEWAHYTRLFTLDV